MAASSPKLRALIEEAKRKHAEKLASLAVQVNTPASPALPAVMHLKPEPVTASVLTAANSSFQSTTGVPLNELQTEAVELAMRGKSINLIGAAGTGKTTTTREIIGQLVRLPHITPIMESTKYLSKGSPGIIIISFTNKAVNNIKKFLPEELKKHCKTYHKLLQYAPTKSFDPFELEQRGFKEGKGMFVPTFSKYHPLPHIACVIVEESSMVSAMRGDIHANLMEALPNPEATQFIFLGDLNQLPPIFGPSILGFKLLELKTVELTHVYRQALESPIITLAHKIREGRGLSTNWKGKGDDEPIVDDRGEHGKVIIRPWKKRIEPGPACKVLLNNFLLPMVTSDDYDFTENIILCPFNKSFGTLELNRAIADALGKKRGAEVFEVVARGTRTYWAVGDRVLVDRREAVITKIEPTAGYSGNLPQPSSKTLDRWGRDKSGAASHSSVDRELLLLKGMDALDAMDIGDDSESLKNAASHTITVEFVDDGGIEAMNAAGDINSMLFSYVLTVHKSQGSEWKRVFILLHYSHNTMLSRELLYTAVTRARQELYIICEPDRGEVYNSITRAARSPEIQGVTLKEKAQYFMAKRKSMAREEAQQPVENAEEME